MNTASSQKYLDEELLPELVRHERNISTHSQPRESRYDRTILFYSGFFQRDRTNVIEYLQ